MDQETVNILDYYFGIFDQTYVKPIIFIEFTTILILVFLIRYLMLYHIEKNKNKKKYIGDLKSISLYIIGHCAIELLVSFFICYCLIKLTHANPQSYIINMIAAPSLGVIIAIYLDNRILIPIENATGLGNVFIKLNNKKKSNDKSGGNSGNSTSNVTINIGTQQETKIPDMTILKPSSVSDLLSDDIADDEDFNSKIINAVNEIKKEQATQFEIINSNTAKLESTISDLAILKESEMINKKIELKKMIYACLNKGYATPEENDKITMYYYSYTSLGGNHEVESLYKNHYLKLPVHEDDMDVIDILPPASINRKQQTKRVYLYGEFDNVVDDQK